MDLLLFCTAFILQYVGHRVGDYLFQTNTQAINKATKLFYRLKHCLVYSLVISLIMLLAFEWHIVTIVFVVTLLEHLWIDSRKPVLGWKTFLERKIAKNEGFQIEELPFFVVIDIDQTFHLVRLFIISVVIGFAL